MSFPHRLDRRLDLEECVHTPDGSGGFEVTWTNLGRLPAAVVPRSGREQFANGRAQTDMSVRIFVRAAPVSSPARPKPQQRLRDGVRIYEIEAVAEARESPLYLEIWARMGEGE